MVVDFLVTSADRLQPTNTTINTTKYKVKPDLTSVFSCVVLLLHSQLISFVDLRAPKGPLTQISQRMQAAVWQAAVQKQMFRRPLGELSSRYRILYFDPS